MLYGSQISTILKHDSKVTSYKFALLRAINDVILAYSDLRVSARDIAIPIRSLAERWAEYYWPFMSPEDPIMQGPRSRRGNQLSNDVAFRPALTAFRQAWEVLTQADSRPSDGYIVTNELRILRKRSTYPPELLRLYEAALKSISTTIQMPIRYAGPAGEQWTVFARPARLSQLPAGTLALPGSNSRDLCLLVPAALASTFRDLSLWIEALCIHEWCLFTERVEQVEGGRADRGYIYTLLTDHPANRRPLTWERNQIDALLMEGQIFVCPWTEHRIHTSVEYALDHILPVAVFPINELWNLVPADPRFNSHIKRDRIPTYERLYRARSHLVLAYANYELHTPLAQVIREDAKLRFSAINDQLRPQDFTDVLATSVIDLINQIADTRNLTRF